MIKTFAILTALLLSPLVKGQTIISSIDAGYVTSTVYQYGSSYKYEYIVDSKIDNKKITETTINLSDALIYNIVGDDEFQSLTGVNYVTFWDIKPKDDYFVVSYYSNNIPDIFSMSVDTSKDSYNMSVYAPIPEPSLLSLSAMGLLLNRRRR